MRLTLLVSELPFRDLSQMRVEFAAQLEQEVPNEFRLIASVWWLFLTGNRAFSLGRFLDCSGLLNAIECVFVSANCGHRRTTQWRATSATSLETNGAHCAVH